MALYDLTFFPGELHVSTNQDSLHHVCDEMQYSTIQTILTLPKIKEGNNEMTLVYKLEISQLMTEVISGVVICAMTFKISLHWAISSAYPKIHNIR